MALAQIAGPPLLLRNDQQTNPHWLRLCLEDRAPDPHALAAIVEVTAGGVTLGRKVVPTRRYLCQVVTDIPLGLGTGPTGKSVRRLLVT